MSDDLGVVCARLALAETGSVLLLEDELTDRGVSLLTAVLVQIVEQEKIVAQLDAIEALLVGPNRPIFARCVRA